MTQLAADRAAGVQPYLVPPSHTARARAALGAGPLLAPVQTSVVDTDPVTARATARWAIAPYLRKPNYVRTWLEGGFTQGDFADGGSDHLVDSLVVWGSADVVARRVLAHLEAGADHVALQIVTDTPHAFPLTAWRAVAERLPQAWPPLSTVTASGGPQAQDDLAADRDLGRGPTRASASRHSPGAGGVSFDGDA
ncbi:hypothetical protein ACIRRH_33810 [Kitasatospora sp. NPDC101235]|uniref:hypothetical protein n=1 Tax=Kitasatospora sp. NPDC101235 TaxID=3364101 RepID=UPI00381703B3